MKSVFLSACTILFMSVAHAGGFSIAFNWQGLKLCTSGHPNTVSNPAFVVRHLPAGTKVVEFQLHDLNVPTFNHGGGTVTMKDDGVVAPGAFQYQSPCPPSGKHKYEWTATAKSQAGFFGKTLGVAKADRYYP